MDEILPDDLFSAIEPTIQAAVSSAENLIGQIGMVAVNSSDIAAWGYAPLSMQLQIQFTNGRMYLYEGISPFEFEQLMLAPSKGSAFWTLIRRNPVAHPFTRIS